MNVNSVYCVNCVKVFCALSTLVQPEELCLATEALLGAFKSLFLQRWLCATKYPISGLKDWHSTLRVNPRSAWGQTEAHPTIDEVTWHQRTTWRICPAKPPLASFLHPSRTDESLRSSRNTQEPHVLCQLSFGRQTKSLTWLSPVCLQPVTDPPPDLQLSFCLCLHLCALRHKHYHSIYTNTDWIL